MSLFCLLSVVFLLTGDPTLRIPPRKILCTWFLFSFYSSLLYYCYVVGGVRNLHEPFIVFRLYFKPEERDGRKIGETLLVLTFLVSTIVAR